MFTLDKSECKLVEFDKSELRLIATFDKSERLLGRDAVVRFATVADKPSDIEKRDEKEKREKRRESNEVE